MIILYEYTIYTCISCDFLKPNIRGSNYMLDTNLIVGQGYV